MIRLGSVVLGVDDIERGVQSWSQALGYELFVFPDDDGFTSPRPPSGEGTRAAAQRADTPVDEHPRIHLDLVVDDDAPSSSPRSSV